MYKNSVGVIEVNPNRRSIIIPEPVNILNIEKTGLILSNGIYEKFKCKTEIEGELIICKNKKLDTSNNLNVYLVKETYEEYLETKAKRNIEKDRWIYNIVDGISEKENIIYEDYNFVLIPNYVWNKKSIEQLHILGIVRDKSIQTMRDLDSSHIDLLNHIKTISLEKIKSLYKIDENKINIYVHYTPSAYLLHIHFVNIENLEANSSFEYSYGLDNIIFNLGLCSDYYKLINLTKRHIP